MAASKPEDVAAETPLPEGWRKAATRHRKGQFYYVSHTDRFTTWEDPRVDDPEPIKQEQSVLEYLIRAYNFVKADYHDKGRLEEDFRRNLRHCREEWTEETFRACLHALQEQICVEKFPLPENTPEEMVAITYKQLQSVMQACVGEGRVKQETCQELLFDFLQSLLRYGPGSTASYFISKNFMRPEETTKYLKDLQGERLIQIIDSLKSWRYIPEVRDFTRQSHADYWGKSMNQLLILILGNYESDKIDEQEILQHFLDLYLFYFTKMIELPLDFVNCLEDVTETIATHYHDQNPYKFLEDPEILRKHLQTVGNTLCSEKYKGKHRDIAENLVRRMIDGILTNTWIAVLLDDIIDLMKRCCLADYERMRPIISRLFKILGKTDEQTYDENPQIINKLLPMFEEVVKKKPEHVSWVCDYLNSLSRKINPRRGSEQAWLSLMKVLTKTMHKEGVYRSREILCEPKFKVIWNWKRNYKEALDIIEPLADAHLHLKGKDTERLLEVSGFLLRTLLDQFKVAKIAEKLHGHVAEMTMAFMEKKSRKLSRFVEEYMRDITLEANKELIPGLLKRFTVLFYDSDFMMDDDYNSRFGCNFMKMAIEAYRTGKEIPDEVNKIFVEMFLWIMETEDLEYVDMKNGDRSIYGRTVADFLHLFMRKHIGKDTSDVIVPLIPVIMKLLKHEEQDITNICGLIVYQISSDNYKLLTEHLEALVEWYKDAQSDMALISLWKALGESDGFSTPDFCVVMKTVAEDVANSKAYSHGMLFKLMAERQAELFTQEHVDMMIKRFLNEKISQGNVLMALGEVIAVKPEIFADNVITNILQNPNLDVQNASSVQVIAVNLGLKKRNFVNTIFEELLALAKCWHDPNHQIYLLDSVRILGSKYGVETLRPHRKYFEELQKFGMSSPIKDTAGAIVNAMDGISMEGIITDVIQTKRKVKVLDEKVKKAETEVSGMKTIVAKQTKDIKAVESGLKTVGKRVDVVEKDLEETKVRVEEIDNKTLSNAPLWSKDLSKLMNPKSDHDWRLLAQRLGYSLEDIKAWATHSDPCMALLSEWYSTHKMIEATHAILNILQDINRLDAAVIVENAMKAAEDVIEEAPEYTKPPPIFLSYQWGHQNEVKLLRQHLLMAGYECWLDVGQMGGGDKLFEKIDRGIRGAKVVICCVSEKYAKSPNCNREVNLSVNLGKPMIPLLMEKMGWPPQGSMGPIFSEYLFVRFFQRKGEETKDQRYWSVPKFQELLMQLNMYKTMPDESLITKEYRQWWLPVTEEIVINKKSIKGGQSAESSTGDEAEKITSPDVFLSYQWGKQNQVKQLYKRLTELGLTCWMDIYQMGGGDSLFDKIDRGVRGCKIVLTCVTTKYTVSANCRREVSLADTLKKPVVSLLLENMKWPLSGPMNSVITQFPLIDFKEEEEVQMTWTGDKFDDLLDAVMKVVPNTIGYVRTIRKNESKAQENTADDGGIVARTSDGNEEANELEGAQGVSPETSLQKPTPNKQTSGEKTKIGLASVDDGEKEADEELPPTYDSLFSQTSSSKKTTTNLEPSPKSPPQPIKKSLQPPPPPYPYLHQYVKTPPLPQPPTEAELKSKKKSKTCVIA